METINYISSMAMPVMILLIITYALIEKNKIFDTFLEGVKEGIQIVINIFPTLLGLFVAVGALKSSGILDLIINMITPIISFLKVPVEIMPLAMLRPISGSASLAIATEMMRIYGVDSTLGKMISTLMGSTETTLYTIAIYTSAVGIKKIRFVLIAALLGDLIGMITSVVICQVMS